MNTPFLQQVVNHYIGQPGLEDYCFVFPNRRSGQFFVHYLQESLVAADNAARRYNAPHLLPCVTSINDLVGEITGTAVATDIEMMFALYDAYCQAMGDKAQEFDKFIYWAQLIISDFNDIDRSLADAHEVYQNLDDLHSLSSNYLSPEVQEQVKRIFGENLFTSFFDTSADADLWQRRSGAKTAAPDAQVKEEFMSLWNALETIYHRYHEALKARNVVSPGRQLRLAVDGNLDRLRYDKLVFVGFGVLSAAEFRLLDRFKLDKKADFWWDNAGLPALLEKASHDPGALLIKGYCDHFGAKQLEPVCNQDQEIRVVGVSSMVGQAKQAFNEVAAMNAAGTPGIETAIVLPDESLLVPLLHSVHNVGNLNVTLGYPLRSSGIVSLMHIVSKLHHQAGKERGVWTYYREDVNDILSHPLIKTYFTQEVIAMTTELSRTNRFRVPAVEFEKLSFNALFKPAIDSQASGDMRTQQVGYVDNLLAFCNILLEKMNAERNGAQDDEENSDVELPLQQAFLMMYIDVLNQLKQALAGCCQTLQSSTVFYLVDRLTAAAIVPFTGQPLKGLQIMGLLETRSLDFEHVVILSMNERIFPRRRSINSFIPNYIRRAHGMSTIEQQEAIVAFNFYRLLNRSRHVTLIYDSSVTDAGPTEPSRYIAQLEKIYGFRLKHVEMTPDIRTASPIAITVPHDACPELSDLYTRDPERSHGKYLSASAINKYLDCPLLFYMHYVQKLNNDNEVSDFMDPSTFGSIVHETLGDCYDSELSRARGGLIDAEYIESFKKNYLNRCVVRNIKKIYLHIPEEKIDESPLRGEPFMLMDTIESYVKFVLDYDVKHIMENGTFTVLECEKSHLIPQMRLGDAVFNFFYKPDRVDRLENGVVRLIDYKTGGEETQFSSLDNLFVEGSKKRCSGILQLLLYCYAYLTENPSVKQVMPVIYRLGQMQSSGVWVAAKAKGEPASQYVFSMDDELAKAFVTRMAGTISAIYQNDFTQASPKSSRCNYCRFVDFCRRSPKKFN